MLRPYLESWYLRFLLHLSLISDTLLFLLNTRLNDGHINTYSRGALSSYTDTSISLSCSVLQIISIPTRSIGSLLDSDTGHFFYLCWQFNPKDCCNLLVVYNLYHLMVIDLTFKCCVVDFMIGMRNRIRKGNREGRYVRKKSKEFVVFILLGLQGTLLMYELVIKSSKCNDPWCCAPLLYICHFASRFNRDNTY